MIQDYINDLRYALTTLNSQEIKEVVQILHEARLNGRNIFVIGNGGSASTASHMVCDLAKNTKVDGIPHICIQGLVNNIATFSAYANDRGYKNVFVDQLENFITPFDIVIGISTSGKSRNILEAILYAHEAGAITIGLTGFNGGYLKNTVHKNIHVSSDCIEQVEDIHLVISHIITTELRQLALNHAKNM